MRGRNSVRQDSPTGDEDTCKSAYNEREVIYRLVFWRNKNVCIPHARLKRDPGF